MALSSAGPPASSGCSHRASAHRLAVDDDPLRGHLNGSLAARARAASVQAREQLDIRRSRDAGWQVAGRTVDGPDWPQGLAASVTESWTGRPAVILAFAAEYER